MANKSTSGLPELCSTGTFASRICERGTKGCTTQHMKDTDYVNDMEMAVDACRVPHKTGFMCQTDYLHLLGDTHIAGSTEIFNEVNELRGKRTCVAKCGIVEVSVCVTRVVEQGELGELAFGKKKSAPTKTNGRTRR